MHKYYSRYFNGSKILKFVGFVILFLVVFSLVGCHQSSNSKHYQAQRNVIADRYNKSVQCLKSLDCVQWCRQNDELDWVMVIKIKYEYDFGESEAKCLNILNSLNCNTEGVLIVQETELEAMKNIDKAIKYKQAQIRALDEQLRLLYTKLNIIKYNRENN